MKNIIVVFLLIFFCYSSFSQSEKAKAMLKSIEGKYKIDDNGNITFSKVIQLIDTTTKDSLSKNEIYNRAYSYFIYNYVSGESVIQLSDNVNGIIVAKGIYPSVHSDASFVFRNIDSYHILRIDIKNGKARIILTLTQYKLTIKSGGHISSVHDYLISQTYPFNEDDLSKTFMSKAFVKTYDKAIASINSLEKAIREGNTSKNIENNEW